MLVWGCWIEMGAAEAVSHSSWEHISVLKSVISISSPSGPSFPQIACSLSEDRWRAFSLSESRSVSERFWQAASPDRWKQRHCDGGWMNDDSRPSIQVKGRPSLRCYDVVQYCSSSVWLCLHRSIWYSCIGVAPTRISCFKIITLLWCHSFVTHVSAVPRNVIINVVPGPSFFLMRKQQCLQFQQAVMAE